MTTAAFGSWVSPITSDLITASTIRISQIQLDADDVYWLESRPFQKGRSAIVRRGADAQIVDMTPEPYNVRTLVHEYGGGAYTVHEGTIYFCNYSDQRIYRQAPGCEPVPLTQPASVRYADLTVDPRHNRLVCVQEDHELPEHEALTTIVSISLKDGRVDMLVAGNDFYANPRLNPDSTMLSWMSWNHPNMPWDSSFVWVANVGSDGFPANIRRVAGSPTESVFQPQWSPAGVLHYVSDRSGWWNIYRHCDYEGSTPLVEMDAEFGAPLWNFGFSTYAFDGKDSIVCAFCRQGIWQLGVINLADGAFRPLQTPYTDISFVKACPGKAFFCAGSPTDSTALIELKLPDSQCQVLRPSNDLKLDSGYLSSPRTLEFESGQDKRAYAFFFPPANKDFSGPANCLPPLIVKSHGGPTGAKPNSLDLGVQYWTSRGFAVVDVNYGGSTGFGRDYRLRLNGAWGIVDVDDCVNAALYLAEHKLVDREKMAITGGSAGGYTTLCALTFRDVFRAGASYYGVSDLESLATDTHKFESRYGDQLVGPYPERRDLYLERSPIHHTDRLKCPVIFFQGLEDKVVPPDQSEKMVQALKNARVPVAYLAFAGEQHGFRKAENIKRALDAELYFYSAIFKFTLPGAVEPVEIDNLDPSPLTGQL